MSKSKKFKNADYTSKDKEKDFTDKAPDKGGAKKQSQKGSNPKFKEGKGPTGKGRNPIEIWNKHPELTKAAGNLSFAQALGQPLDWDAAGGNMANALADVNATPGIMSFAMGLTYGSSKDKGSVLNIAARNIYTYVRHMNSGHTNYDATNLMQYMIAVDQIYAMYAWCRRIYGTLLNYKVLNRYTPDDLLEAQGVDASSFRANMAQFKFDLDQWAVRLQSFLVPDSVDVFKRHFDFFNNYFLDADNVQIAQIYVAYPAKLFAWDDSATSVDDHFKTILDIRDIIKISNWDTVTPSITFNQWFGKPQLLTMSDIELIMDTMLQSIATTEDFNIMSGDIFKAYGASRTWTVPSVDPDYVAEPVFNWEMLVQFHNIVPIQNFKIERDAAVVDAEAIKWIDWYNETQLRPEEILDPVTNESWLRIRVQGWATNRNPLNSGARLLDVPFRDPSPEDVMEATRLMPTGGSVHKLAVFYWQNTGGDGIHVIDYNGFGTEVVLSMSMWQRRFRHLTVHGGYTLTQLGRTIAPCTYLYTNVPGQYVGNAAKFTLAPLSYSFVDLDSTGTWESTVDLLSNFMDLNHSAVQITGYELLQGYIVDILGDLDHHTIVSNDSLDKLHTAAILSAFNVPEGATKG